MKLFSQFFIFSILIGWGKVEGFVSPVSNIISRPCNAASKTSSLNLFGPKQALAIERTKNPAGFEQTINGLMRKNKLTREQAEKRYGEFLIDPDGFAIRAGEEMRKKEGYKTWEEAAIARSDDPEATEERINEFKKKSTIKALVVVAVFVGVLLYLSSTNQTPTVFGELIETPRINPYRAALGLPTGI
mmetsp:Transcript_20896/g.24038  ORF Transcript_20896/g.24038 Transcript_20896/m.24038 type:complete len:188 (-) Transcript_20896:264-827(-)